MSPLAAAGPSAYWYLARATGAVSLLLLTVSVVLGILGSARFAAAPRWPRFAIESLHGDVSLLVIVVLVIHIATSVLDSFAPISLLAAVIPFSSNYRPLWLGLGALGFDLLLALVATSLVRRRLGYRSWRAVHWLAYASWPVAVLHGIGTGSDTKLWWMLALTAACIAAVSLAALVRIARIAPQHSEWRSPAAALAIATPLALGLFTYLGPLQKGWARRAGTPARLLAHGGTPVRSHAVRVSLPAQTLNAPFAAQLSGTATQTPEPSGAIVDLAMQLSGGATGQLRVRLAGQPLAGGGLSMTGSQVDLVANGIPALLAGRITSLGGQRFIARVAGRSGPALNLHVSLNIDGSGNISGTLRAVRAQ